MTAPAGDFRLFRPAVASRCARSGDRYVSLVTAPTDPASPLPWAGGVARDPCQTAVTDREIVTLANALLTNRPARGHTGGCKPWNRRAQGHVYPTRWH